ncbi:MAG TPA: hypothetical protein VJU82_05140, partial [Acidobacteriaceae bacterium]|nr:hypothetical protein [Acidobacteriaceae bacterium]
SIIDESVNTPTGAYSFHPGYEIDSSTANSVSASGYGADYWNGPPSFNVGDTYAIKRATVCLDQPSRSGGTLLSGDPPSPTGWVNESLDPSYEWGDVDESGNPNHGPVTTSTLRLIADRDYYGEVSMSANTSPTSPFNGTTGTGFGTLANRPTTCKTGVAYWATDQGSWNQSGSGQQGELFKCTAANTWTLAYTPYTYPHPLINSDAFSASSARPAAPTNLSGSVQ